jgi:DNA modification methylase
VNFYHADDIPPDLRAYFEPAPQLGLEPTSEAYVAAMVAVFREVRRVLRADGTLWLNMGDSYASGEVGRHDHAQAAGLCAGETAVGRARIGAGMNGRAQRKLQTGLKPKDLVGMPWRLAFALQADGWYLRADIIWAKPNPMPESVTDRPTKAHEYVFLLSKSARYFYDADAVREPVTGTAHARGDGHNPKRLVTDGGECRAHNGFAAAALVNARNLRSVWAIPSAPFPDAHFATFPPALASRCIQAGTSAKGCCRACGAPWVRMVERESMAQPDGSCACGTTHGEVRFKVRDDGHRRNDYADGRTRLYCTASRTTGWHPSCPCPPTPPVPCTVLDPFAGSGTVGQVAEQLRRHSILIELSPAYIQMADERTAQLGLFTQEAPR